MATLGTILFTWWKGELVGSDEFGNRYYRERGTPTRARRRRWVMYEGAPEASKVPPLWNAWLHHVADSPPDETPEARPAWLKPHVPNLTGTAEAYRPPGDMAKGGRPEGGRPPEGLPAAYEPWRP